MLRWALSSCMACENPLPTSGVSIVKLDPCCLPCISLLPLSGSSLVGTIVSVASISCIGVIVRASGACVEGRSSTRLVSTWVGSFSLFFLLLMKNAIQAQRDSRRIAALVLHPIMMLRLLWLL